MYPIACTQGGVFVWVAVFFLLSIGFAALQHRFARPGSDHYIHLAYVDSIRANKHRFITRVNSFINADDFPDPQLYHWLLSFFPRRVIVAHHALFGHVINWLTLGSFLLFCALLYPALQTPLSLTTFIRNAGLLFVLTPFSYYSWNAKNVGLSARGLGLLLGQLYLYTLVFYAIDGGLLLLIGSIAVSLLILLSSQFAFQMVLFASPLVGILLGTYEVILVPLVSILISILLFKEHTLLFLKRQYQYKSLYRRVFAKKFLLTSRYSIWLDFVWSFWIVLRSRSTARALQYIYRNPVVITVLGIPSFTFIVLWLSLDCGESSRRVLSAPLYPLFVPVIACTLVALSTSLRQTRFLGEPERYLEFVIPQLAVLAAVLIQTNTSLLLTIIGFSLAIILGDSVLTRLVAKQHKGQTFADTATQLMRYMSNNHETATKNRVLSNNYDLLKHFAGYQFRILNVYVTSEFTGPFHYNELFPDQYGRFATDVIGTLLKHFKIDWFILDTNLARKEELFSSLSGVQLTEVHQINNFTVFEVCSETSHRP